MIQLSRFSQTSATKMKCLIKQTVVVSWTIYFVTPLPDRQHANLLATKIWPFHVTNGQSMLPVLSHLTLLTQQ